MARRKKFFFGIIALALLAVLFLFWTEENTFEMVGSGGTVIEQIATAIIDPNADYPNQQPLKNPPTIVKGIYSTGWSAGSSQKMKYFLDLLDTTELNAIVIDIKDYTGMVSYETEVSQVKAYNAFEKKIDKINKLIKELHDHDVYVIGRVAVFQDNQLVSARPDLALKSKASGAIWKDRKGVMWLDTAAQPVWDYNIAIAKDALARGFDEINFDYIRFASDGAVNDIAFPYYDGVTAKHEVVRQFFEYVRQQLPGVRLSADLFGEVTYVRGDNGVGQKLEDAFPYFDAISPMTYPSHYGPGFNGFEKPAEHPYEVMKYSIDSALARLAPLYVGKSGIPATETSSGTPAIPAEVESFAVRPTLRPWIQDFDLGAKYTPEMVKAQIEAIEGATASTTADIESLKSGWFLWNAGNVYTKAALLPE